MRIPTFLLTVVACAAPTAGWACSTCKCGDTTITLFGSEKGFDGRFRVALDHAVRSESAGAGLGAQTVDEERTTLGLAYSFSPDLTLALQVPFVRKEIETATLARQEGSGLGDVDFIARWTLHRSGGGLTGRHLAGLRGGVRLPTADEVEDDGQLLDIDAQPDAGATAPNLGVWYSYFRFPWFATVSATYFHFGEGNQDFQPGNALLASAVAQYGITPSLALQAGLDARRSGRNEFDGVTDPDSGGFLAMAFAGVALRVGADLLFSAGIQSPVVDDLHGDQEEDEAFRLGVTYDF